MYGKGKANAKRAVGVRNAHARRASFGVEGGVGGVRIRYERL